VLGGRGLVVLLGGSRFMVLLGRSCLVVLRGRLVVREHGRGPGCENHPEHQHHGQTHAPKKKIDHHAPSYCDASAMVNEYLLSLR